MITHIITEFNKLHLLKNKVVYKLMYANNILICYIIYRITIKYISIVII